MNEQKKIREEIKHIVRQNGFKQFVLIDSDGGILQQEIKSDKSLFQNQTQALTDKSRALADFTHALIGLIKTIKTSASAIGKEKFKVFTISRKTRPDIFIFPIGIFYMGVIRSTSVNENSNIDNQLNNIVTTQINELGIKLMKTIKPS